MLVKSKILRDTILLTAMQLLLDTSALLLNAFITRRLGASAIGILTLMGSFLMLAGVISNGNAFLCTSRLISEELGKSNSNPNRVLLHGVSLCLLLSGAVSVVVIAFADVISGKFFSGAHIASAVKLMPFALILGAVSACLKGWFNAFRKAGVSAVGEIIEFFVKAAVITVMTLTAHDPDEASVCRIMIFGIIAGSISSFVYFSVQYLIRRESYTGRGSLSFRKYASYAFPIMGGGLLTAVLSSTNDALIPICLRQGGDTAEQAFSRFGIFEAIVIPTLFFPSVVLCSMSGIIVSEIARACAEGNSERIRSIAQRVTRWTVIFAVFASAVLMRFGGAIGKLLGGGYDAGRIITIIAPVVPFIYLEIVCEAIIKGMGKQAFSSLNYLAEYIVRISAVLIFVPRLGFYGIVASYYSSNVIGNCSRLAKTVRLTGMKMRPVRDILVPPMYAFLTMGAAELLMRPFERFSESPAYMCFQTLIWGAGYFAIFCGMADRGKKICNYPISFGRSAQ